VRDYLFMALFLGSLPVWFLRPQLGVLAYIGLSLLNPHRHLYAFYDFRFAFIVGVVTLLGAVLVQRPRIPRSRLVSLVVVWLGFTAITSTMAFDTEQAWREWQQLAKSLLMSLLAMGMLHGPRDLIAFVAVMAASIGFYGVKAGAFSLATGGQHRVYGPDDTFIADNNALALSELMVLPLLVFLAQNAERRWLKRTCWTSVALMVVAIMFSYSRGALLGLIATGGVLLWRLPRRERAVILTLCVLGVAGSMAIAPDRWFDRMGTMTEDYQEDSSLMGRINAWWFAYNVASTHMLGGGFGVFTRDQFYTYAPDPLDYHDSHSIYFEVLGEHGFIGLLVFIAILACAVSVLGRITRMSLAPRQRWLANLAAALRASLIAYGVTGAFLGLAYFDLVYYIIAGVVILERLAARERAMRPEDKGTLLNREARAVGRDAVSMPHGSVASEWRVR
jgi:probable O-glycosylation ligase (exosortase A-associated)